MRILLERFPGARLRVLIACDRLWETGDWSDPRVDVISVASWTRALLNEALRVREPVIVVQFAPWPLEDRWRQQIFKTPLPPRSRALHAGLAALFALRPRIVCRHLGDLL